MLPDSYRGTYGKIKYKFQVTIKRPWKFDELHEIPLNIRSTTDLNLIPRFEQSMQRQITRNIGYFNGGPISLHVHTPRSGCVIGGLLPLQVVCSNQSSTPVEKVKFTLRQIVEYHSLNPRGYKRSECHRIMRKEAGGVDKKSEQVYEHVLDVPADLPSTTLVDVRIIQFRYEIQVEAKLGGLFKNLVQTIPLILGTVPFVADSNLDASLTWGYVRPTPGVCQPFVDSPTPPPAMSMPMPYSGNTSISSEAPPQYNQIGSYQSPLNRHSILNASIRSDSSFVPEPSAPPLDFGSPNSTRSSICSQQVWDTPPSYDQVVSGADGSPAASTAAPRQLPRGVVPKRMAPQHS